MKKTFVAVLLLLAAQTIAAATINIGPERRVGGEAQLRSWPRFVWVQDHFFAYWLQKTNVESEYFTLMFQRFAANGDAIDGEPIALRELHSPVFYPPIAAAVHGDVVLVVAKELVRGEWQLTANRLRDAVNLDLVPFPIARLNVDVPYHSNVVVTSRQSGFVIAYDEPIRSSDIHVVSLFPEGGFDGPSHTISSSNDDSVFGFATARDGTIALLWADQVIVNCGPWPCAAPSPTLRVSFFNARGEPKGTGGVELGRAPDGAAIAPVGDGFAIVWNTLQGIHARALRSDGTMGPVKRVGAEPRKITLGGSAVAWGDGLLVGWNSTFLSADGSARLSATNASLDPITPLRGVFLNPRGDASLFPGDGRAIAVTGEHTFHVITPGAGRQRTLRR